MCCECYQNMNESRRPFSQYWVYWVLKIKSLVFINVIVYLSLSDKRCLICCSWRYEIALRYVFFYFKKVNLNARLRLHRSLE